PLPAEFITAIEILSLCTSRPIYLMLLVIKGVLSGRVEPNTQNPTPKGAPFYIASGRRRRAVRRWPPSAAQTARAVFPHAAFTKTHDLRRKQTATVKWGSLASGRLSRASSILGRPKLAKLEIKPRKRSG